MPTYHFQPIETLLRLSNILVGVVIHFWILNKFLLISMVSVLLDC